jgi:regulator of replication initiation timing
MIRHRNRYNTNNVNICVNVLNNNGGSNLGSPDISQFQDKITTMSSDINLLKTNVNEIMTDNFFETKLHKYLTYQEIDKVKSLVSKYDQLNDLLLNENKSIKYKETEIIFIEQGENEGVIIKAQIDNKWINLNDLNNTDNDLDTLYKLPINGFVIGIEIYTSTDGNIRETFEGIKTSYDSENDITTIYMSKDDYDFVYERRPNNKIHVYSLIISNE